MVLGLALSDDPHDTANADNNSNPKNQHSKPAILYLKRKSEY